MFFVVISILLISSLGIVSAGVFTANDLKDLLGKVAANENKETQLEEYRHLVKIMEDTNLVDESVRQDSKLQDELIAFLGSHTDFAPIPKFIDENKVRDRRDLTAKGTVGAISHTVSKVPWWVWLIIAVIVLPILGYLNKRRTGKLLGIKRKENPASDMASEAAKGVKKYEDELEALFEIKEELVQKNDVAFKEENVSLLKDIVYKGTICKDNKAHNLIDVNQEINNTLKKIQTKFKALEEAELDEVKQDELDETRLKAFFARHKDALAKHPNKDRITQIETINTGTVAELRYEILAIVHLIKQGYGSIYELAKLIEEDTADVLNKEKQSVDKAFKIDKMTVQPHDTGFKLTIVDENNQKYYFAKFVQNTQAELLKDLIKDFNTVRLKKWIFDNFNPMPMTGGGGFRFELKSDSELVKKICLFSFYKVGQNFPIETYEFNEWVKFSDVKKLTEDKKSNLDEQKNRLSNVKIDAKKVIDDEEKIKNEEEALDKIKEIIDTEIKKEVEEYEQQNATIITDSALQAKYKQLFVECANATFLKQVIDEGKRRTPPVLAITVLNEKIKARVIVIETVPATTTVAAIPLNNSIVDTRTNAIVERVKPYLAALEGKSKHRAEKAVRPFLEKLKKDLAEVVKVAEGMKEATISPSKFFNDEEYSDLRKDLKDSRNLVLHSKLDEKERKEAVELYNQIVEILTKKTDYGKWRLTRSKVSLEDTLKKKFGLEAIQ